MPDQEFEKYGVDEVNGGAKTAKEGEIRHCPNCGKRLVPTEKINVLMCPLCGTRPFEEADE